MTTKEKDDTSVKKLIAQYQYFIDKCDRTYKDSIIDMHRRMNASCFAINRRLFEKYEMYSNSQLMPPVFSVNNLMPHINLCGKKVANGRVVDVDPVETLTVILSEKDYFSPEVWQDFNEICSNMLLETEESGVVKVIDWRSALS